MKEVIRCPWSVVGVLMFMICAVNPMLAEEPKKEAPTSVMVELSDPQVQALLGNALPRIVRIPADKASRMASADLNAHVSAMVAGWPLSPLFTMTGAGNVFSFWRPRELFASLSMALPYLAPKVRKQVLGLLDAEIAKNSPIAGTRYEMGGTLRYSQSLQECFSADKYKDCQVQDWEGLYALWAYCYYGDRREYAVSNWEKIKAVGGGALDGHKNFLNQYEWQNFDNRQWSRNANVGKLPAVLNLRISSLIGFIRLAELTGNRADAAASIPVLKDLLSKRAGLVVKNGSYSLPFGGEPVQWYEMTPELAIFLDKVRGDDIKAFYSSTSLPSGRCMSSFARNNFWFLTRGEGQMFAENSLNWPESVLALFKVRCFMYQDDAGTLYRYSDMPWCTGDLSYIDKLTLTLWRATGGALERHRGKSR
jgi:hypothetical protein